MYEQKLVNTDILFGDDAKSSATQSLNTLISQIILLFENVGENTPSR